VSQLAEQVGVLETNSPELDELKRFGNPNLPCFRFV
jgi:hypothetical protein